MLLHDIIQAQFFEARASREGRDGAREPPPNAIDVTCLDHVVALIIISPGTFVSGATLESQRSCEPLNFTKHWQ